MTKPSGFGMSRQVCARRRWRVTPIELTLWRFHPMVRLLRLDLVTRPSGFGMSRQVCVRRRWRVTLTAFDSVAFSPMAATVASGSWDKTIRIWNVKTGVCEKTLEGHTNSVYSVAFSPDGATVCVWYHGDKTIRIWECQYWRMLQCATLTKKCHMPHTLTDRQ